MTDDSSFTPVKQLYVEDHSRTAQDHSVKIFRLCVVCILDQRLLKDFAAISMTSDVPLVFVINPALSARTVKEFIALAKKRSGEISSGSSGSGLTGHVAAEMFARQAGIRLLHIQYKGAAPAVIDLVGGHVTLRKNTGVHPTTKGRRCITQGPGGRGLQSCPVDN